VEKHRVYISVGIVVEVGAEDQSTALGVARNFIAGSLPTDGMIEGFNFGLVDAEVLDVAVDEMECDPYLGDEEDD
jgi:hypothetical protein